MRKILWNIFQKSRDLDTLFKISDRFLNLEKKKIKNVIEKDKEKRVKIRKRNDQS